MLSFLNPLPQLSSYKGPHKVGSAEFEIPVADIERSTAAPDPRITTVKFRVFYPTSPSAASKKSITWLPAPQKVWNQAYAQFMGISEKRASWLSHLPSLLSHVTIPAVQNAPLPEAATLQPYPVVVFSHGLGGNYNTYSSLIGSLASCGVVCVAPEFRDGSSPISLIKSTRDKVETTIPYVKVAHSPTVEVLNARNAQLRVRLWELELTYMAISKMNSGKQFTNLSDTVSDADSGPNLSNKLDLRPGKVTWMGHSFGATTIVQFVKSIYWRQHAPHTSIKSDNEGWDLTPLYTPKADGELAKQVTCDSPVVLLDLWTMPLRGVPSSWLWEKPLPCHDQKSPSTTPGVLSIISAEFFKWPDLRNRSRAVLSASPTQAIESFTQVEPGSPDLKATTGLTTTISRDRFSPPSTSKTPKPAPAEEDLREPVEPELAPIPTNSDTELAPPKPGQSSRTPSRSPARPASYTNASTAPSASSGPARLYHIPNSAHLSQSDFGPLFPNLTRYFLKAQEPEKTMELNIRAILALMRGRGLPVDQLNTGNTSDAKTDRILEDGFVVDRWEVVPLPKL